MSGTSPEKSRRVPRTPAQEIQCRIVCDAHEPTVGILDRVRF
jgi:hypothetical protein